MSAARFEIVRTDADQPWHARFRAANGRIVWTTEQYTRRTAAYGALSGLASSFGYRWQPPIDGHVDLPHWVHLDAGWRIEVRDIDSREVRP